MKTPLLLGECCWNGAKEVSESQLDILREGSLHDFWEYMHVGRPSRFKQFVWAGNTFDRKTSARLGTEGVQKALAGWIKEEVGSEGFTLRWEKWIAAVGQTAAWRRKGRS